MSKIKANLWYIRAAIEQKFGIKLKLRDVAQLLVEEGLLSKDHAIALTADGIAYIFRDITAKSTKIELNYNKEKDVTKDVYTEVVNSS